MIDLVKVAHLDGTPWLCEPSALRAAVARVLSARHCPTAREAAEDRQAVLEHYARLAEHALPAGGATHSDELLLAESGAPAIRAVSGRVGVLPIHGPIQQRRTPELSKAGGTSTDEISRGLDALMAVPDVGAIVLHVDSPGGQSYGVAEVAKKVFDVRGRGKRIYAAVDSLAASAAFWLATAAETVVMTPGGHVGSVGVYVMHVDQSRALDKEGLTVTLVQAGKYKAELSGHQPLGDDARGYLQGIVDDTYGAFVGAVARNRGVSRAKVEADYGQGRLLTASQALKAGAVDRVMPFEDLMARLRGTSANSSQSPRAGASAADLRLRLAAARAGRT